MELRGPMRISKSLQTATVIAYIAAAINLLIIEVLLFGGPATPFIFFVLDLPMQLFYFFIIAALPSPSWARVCGYSACIISLVLLIALLHHLPWQTATGFSYGAIAVRAIWIAMSSLEMKGIAKIVGIVLTLLLASQAFIPSLPYNLTVSQNVLASVFLALWFLLVGRMLTSKAENLPTLISFPVR